MAIIYSFRLMMMSITQGDFAVVDASQWHEKRYDDPEYQIPETVTIWGQNLPATCPDGFFGHWYVDLMKRGTELMVIDPRCTWIASRAKLWLQLRPGTDAALALGFIHVMIKENLVDMEFIQKWTNAPFLVRTDTPEPVLLRETDLVTSGKSTNFVAHDPVSNEFIVWDSDDQTYSGKNTTPSMDGEFTITLTDGSRVAVKTVWRLYKENAGDYTPEKVSKITWVPEDKIIKGARMYAKSSPSALHWGLPIDTIPSTIPTSQAIKKVVEVDECKSDIEINLELSKRFMKDFPYDNTRDLFDSLLKPAGITYQQLCDNTWMIPPKGHPSKPYYRYEKGLLRADGKPGFRTPSGKIELFSSWLEKWELFPMPYHEEPPYSPVSTPDLFKDYPLILTTGRRMGPFFHSEHRQIPWLRAQQKEPVLEIHPDTAQKYGIEHGQKVCVENWLGKITVKALVTPVIHPDIVMAEHGWWFPEKEGAEPSLFGVWDVNVNQLIPMGHEGKGGLGSPIKSMLCKVYKAKG